MPTQITETKVHFLDISSGSESREYLRFSAQAWYIRYGNAYENVSYNEELEEEFQAHLAKYPCNNDGG